jgi:cytochrome c-type biogenesis protein CcmF
MIPELGHFALVIALALAAAQSFFGLYGAARLRAPLMGAVRPIAVGQWVFVVGAFAALAWSFVHNDFSVANVAQHSNSELPVHYRFAATWGSHEGSMLLWVFMLASWTFASGG